MPYYPSDALATSTVPVPVAVVEPGVAAIIAGITLSVNTTMFLGQVVIPQDMIVNQVSVLVSAVGGGDTIDITLYSNDGRTRFFSVTSAAVAGTGPLNTAVPGVFVPAGSYYIAVNPNTGGTTALQFYDTENLPAWLPLINGTIANKAVIEGTLTITAGTPPATVTPSAITSTEGTVAFRLDT